MHLVEINAQLEGETNARDYLLAPRAKSLGASRSRESFV